MVKIVPDDDQQKIYSGNRYVGYECHGIVYAFDKDGYAVEIGRVTDGKTIGAIYLEWVSKKQ